MPALRSSLWTVSLVVTTCLRSLLCRPHWAAFQQGAFRVPSEDASPSRPASRPFFVKGDRPDRAALAASQHMTTDPKNTNIRSRALLHPEQAATDTNPASRFEIKLHITTYGVLFVNVEARSSAEARRKAAVQADLNGALLQDCTVQADDGHVIEEIEELGGGCDE